jgi:hypothetical protein
LWEYPVAANMPYVPPAGSMAEGKRIDRINAVAEGNRNTYFVVQDSAPGTAAVTASYGKSIPYEIGTQREKTVSKTIASLASASNKTTTSTSYNATSLR